MCWRQLFPAKESWLWAFLPNSVFTEIMVITCSQPQWKYYTEKKTLESPLDCKEIQPVHSKGDQSWVFIGRSDAKAKTPVLWPPDAKSWLIGKDSDAGRGLRAGGEGDNRGWDGWMASPTRWIWVWVNSKIVDRQGGLACCNSWGRKESDATERLNWTELCIKQIVKWNHSVVSDSLQSHGL